MLSYMLKFVEETKTELQEAEYCNLKQQNTS